MALQLVFGIQQGLLCTCTYGRWLSFCLSLVFCFMRAKVQYINFPLTNNYLVKELPAEAGEALYVKQRLRTAAFRSKGKMDKCVW